MAHKKICIYNNTLTPTCASGLYMYVYTVCKYICKYICIAIYMESLVYMFIFIYVDLFCNTCMFS